MNQTRGQCLEKSTKKKIKVSQLVYSHLKKEKKKGTQACMALFVIIFQHVCTYGLNSPFAYTFSTVAASTQSDSLLSLISRSVQMHTSEIGQAFSNNFHTIAKLEKEGEKEVITPCNNPFGFHALTACPPTV